MQPLPRTNFVGFKSSQMGAYATTLSALFGSPLKVSNPTGHRLERWLLARAWAKTFGRACRIRTYNHEGRSPMRYPVALTPEILWPLLLTLHGERRDTYQGVDMFVLERTLILASPSGFEPEISESKSDVITSFTTRQLFNRMNFGFCFQ